MAVDAFLVSGGSGGIGQAICRQLHANGHHPIVGYARDKGGAETIARACAGGALHLDLTDSASIDAAIAQLADSTPPLAGVIFAASPPPRIETFDQVSATEMAHQWQVNVEGPRVLLAGLVRNVFRKSRKGIVVGILSKAMSQPGKPAMGRMGAYVIAKHGMAGMLGMAAADYPWLRVRTVSPGFTDTAMLKAAFDARVLELMRERSPFQQPDAVALEVVAALNAE